MRAQPHRAARQALAAPALALALVAAAGCSNLFHSTARPEQTYVLRPAAAAASVAGTAGGAGATAAPAPGPVLAPLQVLHPVTAPGLDGAHIMLVQADYRMNFYLGSRWPAPLSDVVEALAVETLRSSEEWQSIQDSGSAFPSEYALQISVRRFEADYTAGGAPRVNVVLDCTLGAREGRELVASFVAQGSATAGGDRMGEVVAAFESASTAALDSLVRQTSAATRAYVERGTAAAR